MTRASSGGWDVSELLTLPWLLAAALTVVAAYEFYRRGGSRKSALKLRLEQESVLDPDKLGVRVTMRIGNYRGITNVVVLLLTVKNSGPHDIALRDPENDSDHDQRPRIDLPTGMRVLADPWTTQGARPETDVRVARRLDNSTQRLYLHVHQLGAKQTATIRIIATMHPNPVGNLVSTDFGFRQGFIPNVKIKRKGLLANAHLVRDYARSVKGAP